MYRYASKASAVFYAEGSPMSSTQQTPRFPELSKGSGALSRLSASWSDFAVVTTNSPWKLAEPMLSTRPARVVRVETLERDRLDTLAEGLKGGWRIVGMRSGPAGDGAQ